MANSTPAEKDSAEIMGKLSPEVIAAMEGNQKTIDSIHTIQAVITKTSLQNYGNKGSYKLIQTQKIICDCNHVRIEQLIKKFSGDKIYENYGSEVGTIDIDSTESNIDYIPSNDNIFIRYPKWSNSYKIGNNPVLEFQSIRGSTLKENILASAKNGYYFTAKNDKVDGEKSVLLTCDYTNPPSTLRIWVIPSKGFCIKKVEDGSKGKIDYEYTTTLKKYPPGIWWFKTVKVGKFRRGDAMSSLDISINSLTLNEPIDPELFTIWGINATAKTKVYDEIRNITYTLAIDETEIPENNK